MTKMLIIFMVLVTGIFCINASGLLKEKTRVPRSNTLSSLSISSSEQYALNVRNELAATIELQPASASDPSTASPIIEKPAVSHGSRVQTLTDASDEQLDDTSSNECAKNAAQASQNPAVNQLDKAQDADPNQIYHGYAHEVNAILQERLIAQMADSEANLEEALDEALEKQQEIRSWQERQVNIEQNVPGNVQENDEFVQDELQEKIDQINNLIETITDRCTSLFTLVGLLQRQIGNERTIRQNETSRLEVFKKDIEQRSHGVIRSLDAELVSLKTAKGRMDDVIQQQQNHEARIQAVEQRVVFCPYGINACDIYGRTSMHHAAWHGDFPAFESLLRLGANPGMVDHWGDTPLHLAVRNGKTDFVRNCIEVLRFNKDLATSEGKTLIYCARHKEMVDYLLSQNVLLNIWDNYYCTPLDHALINSRPLEIVQALQRHNAATSYSGMGWYWMVNFCKILESKISRHSAIA